MFFVLLYRPRLRFRGRVPPSCVAPLPSCIPWRQRAGALGEALRQAGAAGQAAAKVEGAGAPRPPVQPVQGVSRHISHAPLPTSTFFFFFPIDMCM